MAEVEEIAGALLAWYDGNRRTLPWRGVRDPYRIWVSETMLQQTRVETVMGYYDRFLAAFPDIRALAAAPEDAVLKLWEGLGYYSRARNLHRGARQVTEELGGELPRTAEALLAVKGIGPYTAGAIASIAFGERVPAVDGNVIRVMTRLRGIRVNAGQPEGKREILRAAAELVPGERPGDFNQALMDLGSGVCVPGTPDCAACPLAAFCDARRQGDAERLPLLPTRRPPRPVQYDVLILLSGERVLLRQRTEALLRGLWVFPMAEGWHGADALPALAQEMTGLAAGEAIPAGEARHVFTHRVWEMRLYILQAEEKAPRKPWRPVSLSEMDALALPTAVRAAAEVARRLLSRQEERL